VRDFGTHSAKPVDYPKFIQPVAEAVARGESERGIVLGGSGNGEAIAANKVHGIRCALCWNVETARLARRHNDANVLSLGQRMVPLELALEIVRAWLETDFEGGRHVARIQQIAGIETASMRPEKSGFQTHENTLLIRPEHLNHVNTVFGGYMMQWADEMAFNAASLTFRESAFVTRRFESFDFTSPVRSGDIIKVFARVERRGETSCQVTVWCSNARTDTEVFRTVAVMVNVDASGKKQPIR
jgi:ribose 5-phosphate isomerase B